MQTEKEKDEAPTPGQPPSTPYSRNARVVIDVSELHVEKVNFSVWGDQALVNWFITFLSLFFNF